MLHLIKECGEKGDKAKCDSEFGELTFDVEALGDGQLRKLAVLATYVEFNYNRYFHASPEWTKHPLLYLEEPHFGRGYKAEYLFTCPQECLNHNVFIDVGSLSVI
jgi:hypothetical protein